MLKTVWKQTAILPYTFKRAEKRILEQEDRLAVPHSLPFLGLALKPSGLISTLFLNPPIHLISGSQSSGQPWKPLIEDGGVFISPGP